jgi:hypothetical protein
MISDTEIAPAVAQAWHTLLYACADQLLTMSVPVDSTFARADTHLFVAVTVASSTVPALGLTTQQHHRVSAMPWVELLLSRQPGI